MNGIRGPDLLWRSEVLQTAWGLDARDELRLLDPQTGGWYPTLAEQDRQFIARGRQLAAQGQQLAEQDQQIRELKATLARYQKPRDHQ